MKRNYNRYYQRFKVWSHQPAARISGLVSLTILTVAFFLSLAILPTLKTIGALKKEISDSETVDSKLSKKIAALNTAQETYAKISPSTSLINSLLPQEEAFERISWQIHWLSQQSGVSLISGSFGSFGLVGQPPTKEAKKLGIDLTISGSYQQIKNFIDRLTRFDRLISIEELSIGAKKLKSTANLTANLKLSAYTLTQGEKND